MKTTLITLTLSLFSASAFACIDRDAVELKDGYKALRIYSQASRSFSKCLDKLEDEGVSLKDSQVWRTQRPENETGPVIYTIVVQGKDRKGSRVRLSVDYNLPKHDFFCGGPTRAIPRCF